MYNGRVWLVVKPTVGVPLFFAGIALTSLAIHTAVLTNTTWYPAFYQGGRNRAAEVTTPSKAAETPALAGVQLAAAAK